MTYDVERNEMAYKFYLSIQKVHAFTNQTEINALFHNVINTINISQFTIATRWIWVVVVASAAVGVIGCLYLDRWIAIHVYLYWNHWFFSPFHLVCIYRYLSRLHIYYIWFSNGAALFYRARTRSLQMSYFDWQDCLSMERERAKKKSIDSGMFEIAVNACIHFFPTSVFIFVVFYWFY